MSIRSRHVALSVGAGLTWLAPILVPLMMGVHPAAAAIPSPTNSTCPAGIVVSPDGTACFDVIVRDVLNNPVAGSTVWIDFGQCPITFCPSQPHTGNSVFVVSNGLGVAHFCICATIQGGACGGKIYADGVPLCVAVAPQLRVDIVSRNSIRANYPNSFDLVINNLGNYDAVNVPLWITGIPLDATVDLGFPLTAPFQSAGEPDWNLLDSLTFTSASGRYLPLVIPRVSPGVVSRRINLTVPHTVSSFRFAASVGAPWVDGTSFRNCLTSAGVIQNPGCMATQLTAINDTLANHSPVQTFSGIGVWAKVAWQCEGANTLTGAQDKAREVLGYMKQVLEQGNAPIGCGDPLLPRWRDALNVVTVNSLDPNDKVSARKVLSVGQNSPYTMNFENDSAAALPARTVRVADTLDVTRLDKSTIKLGLITVANAPPVIPPPLATSFTSDLLLRPTMKVRIQVTVNRSNGTMLWDFTSLDPATNMPPANPDSGFLLQNRYPPIGQGNVMFTANPISTLTTGTTIPNKATITFDGVNNPTPLWVSTVDNTSPTSQVIPHSPGPRDSAIFTVRWSSSTPDLKDFTVYVSRDTGKSWFPWRSNTVATADTFVAESGRRYSFYCTSRDTCDNSESKTAYLAQHPQGEDTVPVVVSVPPGWERGMLSLEGASPNPAHGAIQAWFTLPSWEPATLELIDVQGRRVLRRAVGALGPGRHSVTLGSSPRIRAGRYFLQLTQGKQILSAPIVLLR